MRWFINLMNTYLWFAFTFFLIDLQIILFYILDKINNVVINESVFGKSKWS